MANDSSGKESRQTIGIPKDMVRQNNLRWTWNHVNSIKNLKKYQPGCKAMMEPRNN